MSRPGKNIGVWEKSTNPGLLGGTEVSVMIKTATHSLEFYLLPDYTLMATNTLPIPF